MKKIKKLKKYQQGGNPPQNQLPYNDPFTAVWTTGFGGVLTPGQSSMNWLNVQDNPFGQQLLGNLGSTASGLFNSNPMFQSLNKPLGSWKDESKGMEKSVLESDYKRYGVNNFESAAQAWAKENSVTGRSPGEIVEQYVKDVQGRAGKQYDSTIMAQKQYKQLTPAIAAYTALDELNRMQDLERKKGQKVSAYTLDDAPVSSAFRGYAQQGGVVDMVSKLGYKDNSPFKNAEMLNIKGNKVTMDGVSQSLVGIPVLPSGLFGRPVLMSPNSGNYTFGGATSVVEIPVMQDGGTPEGSNGDVKKSWREGKKLAVYMDGSWHHFGDSSMQDFRQHKSEERKEAWYARHREALKGDDPRSKAFRIYAKKTWEEGGEVKSDDLDKYQAGGTTEQPIPQEQIPQGITQEQEQELKPLYLNGDDTWEYSVDEMGEWVTRMRGREEWIPLEDPQAKKTLESALAAGQLSETPYPPKKKMQGGTVNLSGIENPYSQKPYGLYKSGGYVRRYQPNKDFQRGGTPIQTTDPNDPRIKSYQDSLSLYNNYIDLINKIKKGGNYEVTPEVSGPVKVTKSGKYVIENPNNPIVLRTLSDGFSFNEISDRGLPNITILRNSRIQPTATEIYTRKESKYKSQKDYEEAAKKLRTFSETQGDANWIGYSVQRYKKPIQPIELISEQRVNTNIEPIPSRDLEPFVIPQRNIDIPRLEHPDYEDEEMVKNSESIPNVKVILRRRKSDGQLVPVAYENQSGQRIVYSEPISRKFQYPERFESGGLITGGDDGYNRKSKYKNTTPKNGPMGPKGYTYDEGIRDIMNLPKVNEYISTENLIPIQAEKDELIVLPTGDIVPVQARKRHHQMDEDEVTDVTPENSYILSAHGDVRINKNEADYIITEMGVKPYRIGQTQEKPTQKSLSELMTKKQMSPADLAKKVLSRFPVTPTNNPYEIAANTENKIARRPYLEGIIALSEYDKARKGIDTSTPEATRQYRDGMEHGGGVRANNINHAVDPLTISLVSGGLQALTGIFGGMAQRRAADKAYRDVVGISDRSAALQRQNIGLGAAAGIAGTLAQDPNVDAVQLDPAYIRQMQVSTPLALRQSMANRAYANMPNYNNVAPNIQTLSSLNQASYAAALKQAGDAEMNIWERDRAAKNQQLSALQGYMDTNTQNRIAALNAIRLNRNQMIGNVGDRTQGFFDSSAAIEANRANTQASARLGQAANQQQSIRTTTQGIQSLIGTAGAGLYDHYSNNPSNQATPQMAVQSMNNLSSLTNPIGGNIQMINGVPHTTGYNPLMSNGQFSTGCIFLGGKWINRITGGPC